MVLIGAINDVSFLERKIVAENNFYPKPCGSTYQNLGYGVFQIECCQTLPHGAGTAGP